MKRAIIDIGSNSVRIMYKDGSLPYKELITTRLGQGLTKEFGLTQSAIERTANAVLILYKRALERDVDDVKIFATEALRSAVNGKVLTDIIKKATNLTVDVISGEREAEIGLIGALGLNATGGIIDVGGASTEVVYAKNGNIVYKHSLDIGAVRIFDKFGKDRKLIENYLSQKIKEYGEIYNGEYKIIGGTATALASVVLGLKEYDMTKTHNLFISLDKISQVINELYSLTDDQICEKYCVGKARAEIIRGGASIFYEIIKYARLDGVTVSESDNLEGYYLTL